MPRVKFIVAHDTGNPGSTAKNNVDYFKRTFNEADVSAHLFVDDKEIVECIPAFKAPEKAWHVLYNKPLDNQLYGGDANDIAIGVELCFGGKINTREAYKRYVWLMAKLCFEHKLDPLKDIIGHSKLDPGRKVDPESALKTIGKDMKSLISDVAKELKQCTTEENRVEEPKELEAKDMSKYFKDVPNTHYSAEHVDNLYELGILMGNGGTATEKATLGFGEAVTIERVATVISRALELAGVSSKGAAK